MKRCCPPRVIQNTEDRGCMFLCVSVNHTQLCRQALLEIALCENYINTESNSKKNVDTPP